MKFKGLLFVLAVFISISLLRAESIQKLLHPYNLDFEEGSPGTLPLGWVLPGYAFKNNFEAEVSTELPKSGNKCFLLRHFSDSLDVLGSVMQTIDARPYRGKIVRFRAAVRAEIMGPSGSAHLWLRAHLPDNCPGFEDLGELHPVVVNNWEYYEITGRIDKNAEVLNYGLMLIGNGKAWIDDASLDIIDSVNQVNAAAAPLSPRGLENIKAFVKMYGYVRYFYPGELALTTDWEEFLLNGIDYFEGESSDSKLIEKLNKMYSAIAPDLEIYSSGKKPRTAKDIKAPKNALPKLAIARRHTGPDIESNATVLKSDVVNVYASMREKEGSVFQVINAEPYRGKRISFNAYVKADVIPPSGQVHLAIRIDKDENQVIYTGTMFDNPITKNSWEKYGIEANVPDNASTLRIGLVLIGEGKAWFDDTQISIIESGKSVKNFDPRNNGFEDSDTGKIVNGWFFHIPSEEAGYYANVVKNEKKSGDKSLMIYSDELTGIKLPKVGEVFVGKLSDRIAFSMPLTCFADTLGSLPRPKTALKLNASKEANFIINGNDRTSRLAIVAMLWNIFRHFSVYDGEAEITDGLLDKYLAKAALDKNKDEFLITLKMMTAELNDDQARVWAGFEKTDYGLPFLWKYIDGKLVIYKVFGNNPYVFPGDIVTEIDGKPMEQVIKEFSNLYCGENSDWIIIRGLAELRAGNKNSKILLKIKSASGPPFEQEFSRNMLLSETVETKLPAIAELKKGIYYIDLTRVNDEIVGKNIYNLLKGQGVIFDIRGFSPLSPAFLGSFLNQSENSINWRLPIFTIPDHKFISYQVLTKMISPKGPGMKYNITFVADDRTYGNSEALLTLARYYRIGNIVGSPTAGMAAEVIGFRLPGDYYFTMTGLIGIAPDGKEINRKQIIPDIEAKQTLEGLVNGRDDALERAIKFIETGK
ncbi:MAG: S41 family peptidase [Bacteroidetes bacterium]|nr:S41 family peptidase [Bacteroidota bacterium]